MVRVRMCRLNVACLLQLNFHILIGTATWRVPEVTVRIDRLLWRVGSRLFPRTRRLGILRVLKC